MSICQKKRSQTASEGSTTVESIDRLSSRWNGMIKNEAGSTRVTVHSLTNLFEIGKKSTLDINAFSSIQKIK